MPHRFFALVALTILATRPSDLVAQSVLNQQLPYDPAVTVGQLDNGMRYYVRANQRPEDRAELRLVVDAGSVLEDDDQLGLAHFVEHMAFNGTERFPKQELVQYLERIGMRFGADINASTNFDQTVYQLTVPTDSPDVVRRAFEIMGDWAHAVTFDPEQVEAERGVVIEEWRLGRGAQARMLDQQFPILFSGSHYADRLPIGTVEHIRTFEIESLRRFYDDWYRPDLMAVVAVGDFDVAQIEAMIRDEFGAIAPRSGARRRESYDVPSHDETLYAIATDAEETTSTVAIYYKKPARTLEGTVAAYRTGIIDVLYASMLNDRFFEIQDRPDAPFMFASSGQGRFVRPLEVFFLVAGVAEAETELGFEALLTEAERVAQHGFTLTEIERKKIELMRNMQRVYDEREKRPSVVYAGEYVRNFLEDEAMPGIDVEYQLYQMLLPQIALEDVNARARELLVDGSRVVLATAPDIAGTEPPSQAVLARVFGTVLAKEIAPYVETLSDAPLVAELPEPGAVVAERYVESLDVTDWTLANGVRVILKPTDFRDDQIVFQAMSPGGTSLVEDEDYVAAMMATSIIDASGIGEFSRVDLDKTLAGKVASVFPQIYGVAEGMQGSASPQDAETMFQLIYLYFTAPRRDSTAFVAYRQRSEEFIRNRDASPFVAFGDTLTAVLSQSHFRMRPFTEELLQEMDLDKSFDFYQDRFADAGDFVFAIVGNFTPDSIRPLVERYLGGLPSIGRIETFRDVGIRPPEGVIRKEVRRGVEPQSQTELLFTGPFENTAKSRHVLGVMGRVLELWLREELREALGGTYSVNTSANAQRIPTEQYTVGVSFGSAPDRLDELVAAVFANIDSLQTYGPTEDDLTKIRQSQRLSRQESLRENGFWVSQLIQQARYDIPLEEILAFDELLESLTAEEVRQAAQAYLRVDNYILVTLVPEAGPVN